jgi:uncharacterized protein (TIGR02118 family)
MVKLIALYKVPEDTQAFDEHYENIHTPLAKKMPGLQKIEVTRILGTPMGTKADYHLLAEMYFTDEEALKSSMGSPDGKAAAKDLMGFAGKLVNMMIGQVVED